jgi:ubiquinone biosynthesis protein Coq4
MIKGNKKQLKVEYAASSSTREKAVLLLLEKTAPLHYILAWKRKAWDLCSDDLYKFPEGSLGNTLARFYKKQGFEPVPKAERHDVFHVLLGYSTAVPDEAAMQFFLLGNGKWSLFSLGTAIICAILFPVQWKTYRNAYKAGKSSVNISKWDFRELLHCDLKLLQKQIFNKAL